MSDWILIVGFGSIGLRHGRNLKSLGYGDVRLMRSGRRPPEGFETPAGTRVYDDLDAAFGDHPRVVVVSNPSSLHAEVTRAAVRAGACVLLEKPVCADVNEARALQADVETAGGVVSMAYCFRYHPLYGTLARWAGEGRLGRIFHIHSWQASYLPSWHPWEDYRDSYAARDDLGGGVVRTLDHELDMLRWIAGSPAEVIASAGSLSGIDVDVEDTADMIFRYPGRMQAHVHVCFGRPDYARGMWIAGENAGATLSWSEGTATLRDSERVLDRVVLPDDYDVNEMYIEMLVDAMNRFTLHPPRAPIPLSDGVAALEMADAALQSSRSSRSVHLNALVETP